MVPGKVGSDMMTLFSGGITVYERIVMNRKVWVISGLMIIALGFSVSAAPVHAEGPRKNYFQGYETFRPRSVRSPKPQTGRLWVTILYLVLFGIAPRLGPIAFFL